MKIKRKLRPGQAGTKRWVEKFGDELICVRYRYDEEHKRKITTVEIIVKESAWEKKTQKIPVNKIMPLKVNYGEQKLVALIMAAGGRWNKKAKVWELPYGEVMALGLEKSIVNYPAVKNI